MSGNKDPGAPRADVRTDAGRPRVSRLAAVPLVLAVASWLFTWLWFLTARTPVQATFGWLAVLSALAALLCGVLVRQWIRRSGGRLKGRTLGLVAILCSMGWFVFMGVESVNAILTEAEREALQTMCSSNLKQIAGATRTWVVRYGGGTKCPLSLEALLDSAIIQQPVIFCCPMTGSRPGEGRFICDYDSILDRAGFPLTTLSLYQTSTTEWDKGPFVPPLAWDKEPTEQSYSGKFWFPPLGRKVVYLEGYTLWFSEPEFQTLLKKIDTWIQANRPKR